MSSHDFWHVYVMRGLDWGSGGFDFFLNPYSKDIENPPALDKHNYLSEPIQGKFSGSTHVRVAKKLKTRTKPRSDSCYTSITKTRYLVPFDF